MNVSGGKIDCRLDRVSRVANAVMALEARPKPHQDVDGVFRAGFVDVDFLESASQGAVFLEVLPVFLVGRRPDAPQSSAL